MTDRIERELQLSAPAQDIWDAVTSNGWLADEVELELWAGGDAVFRTVEGDERRGWVEDVVTPGSADPARLVFWWADDAEPASRVELTIEPVSHDSACVRVIETRPLEQLHAIASPLPRSTGYSNFGPTLVAA